MEKRKVHYYESHITIDPVPEDKRECLQNEIKPFDFKLAKLLMQKGSPSNLDTFMTGRSDSYDKLFTNMVNTVQHIEALGYKVRRHKIEEAVWDSYYGDMIAVFND